MALSRFKLRYPVLGDSPDVPRDVGNAVADVDTLFGRLFAASLQQGRFDAASLAVTAGGGMSVNVAAGLYCVRDPALPEVVLTSRASSSNLIIATAHATLPRIDQITVDSTGTLAVLNGTPGSGATLDNRTGAASLPAGSERLADILVPAASATVLTANIRDRRAWARGAYTRLSRAVSNYTASTTTLTALDTTNLRVRLECTGVPLQFHLHCYGGRSVANTRYDAGFLMDAATLFTYNVIPQRVHATDNVSAVGSTYTAEINPPAGSHLIDVAAAVGDAAGGTATIYASSVTPLHFSVKELVTQDANNGVV